MEYYSAIKKNEILPFATTSMDLKSITLSEISQTEKDKYHMISFTCGIQRTKEMKKQNRNRLIDAENKLMLAREIIGWVKKLKGLRSTNW